MGCGLRKLEDPDDSSPGKIFSTLKRPQVETKTDIAYEYVLLDFTLEGSSKADVININSLLDIPSKVEEYYRKGYVVVAIHPTILSVGRRRHLPVSYLYRAVLSRPKPSQKHTAHGGQRHPRLVIEEWPLKYETLTNEIVKGLLEKVNETTKRGIKFVGFISQHGIQSRTCNGANPLTETDGDLETAVYAKMQELKKCNPDEHCRNMLEGTLSGQSSETGTEEEVHMENEQHQAADCRQRREGSPQPGRREDMRLFAVFNISDDLTCQSYHEGSLSMKVTRKGHTISTLEADWLELTTCYYKQGLSLVDSFVHWETIKGDHSPKSLEGLFIYEEESSGVSRSNRKGNDSIVVEQWTVIEGCDVKTDYGPLLHTLAEFGWLLTCVLPTPIIRHDSEGNLATKQVVFLQRPVMFNTDLLMDKTEKKSTKQVKSDEKSNPSNRSVGVDSNNCIHLETDHPSADLPLSPPRSCWASEGSGQYGGFSSFISSASILRELDDIQLDQEDGVTQVTCM
ncbi:raftlin-2 [Latimeria chalumnae]|uniref:Raftlin family member 2 n=1 Tax=Latimeria chalumnae TaxID=7897 RepID=H3B6W1_LATCH|nr:PREDICTED: raftlin-2 [Latimeria chalumnae]|eukprot:XP_005989569.1 PREDICTED: raftlin-2 [Latimeria chalumnae]